MTLLTNYRKGVVFPWVVNIDMHVCYRILSDVFLVQFDETSCHLEKYSIKKNPKIHTVKRCVFVLSQDG